MFEDLISEYKHREPAGTDAWNPLKNDLELWHRIRLLRAMTWAFAQLPMPIEETKILDVGCGVGRSTRMTLELGARPQNVIGIDIRPEAVEYARLVNPGIVFQVVQDFEGWPPEQTFDLCMQCTAFGSILGMERRLALASQMAKMLKPDGYIFWWDSLQANPFAGGDALDPAILFKDCDLVAYQRVALKPLVKESLQRRDLLVRLGSGLLQRYAGHPPTHCAALLKKKDPTEK